MDIINLIAECAGIPSFSAEEHRIHPFIVDFINKHSIGEIERVHKNNLIVYVHPKTETQDKTRPLVALTAHLDKIDHFGDNRSEKLPVVVDGSRITGQLDDAAGIGICLYLAYISREEQFPPLLLLFSEMEEHGPYINPYRGIVSGLGAARISKHLLSSGTIPSLILTIDTTPFYRGANGVSLYSRFWEKCKFQPSDRLITCTEKLENYFLTQFPGILHQNNKNDYITYGRFFNMKTGYTLPSIALEPAIYPYHTKGEGVFISDIQHTVFICRAFLTLLNKVEAQL